METGNVGGESLVVPERVILAPAPGRFRPVDGGSGGADGEVSGTEDESGAAVEETPVSSEQLIGFVDGVGHSTEVRSPFSGLLMGLMAHAGERVREGQPVAWMRLA